jgi:hypothetical protein
LSERNLDTSTRYIGWSITSVKSSPTGNLLQLGAKIALCYFDYETQTLALFQKSLVHVITSHGLGKIVRNCFTMGMIAKWALKFMGLDIMYVPQMTIKSHALLDLVAE